MDRTVATGTGYIGQYPPELARIYESLKTCPDNLLFFIHQSPTTTSCTPGKPSSSMSMTPTMPTP